MISKPRPLRDLASVILRIIKDERKVRKEERTKNVIEIFLYWWNVCEIYR